MLFIRISLWFFFDGSCPLLCDRTMRHIVVVVAGIALHPVGRQLQHPGRQLIDKISVVGHDEHGAVIMKQRIFQFFP